jgi:hypothetical protein
MAVFKDLIDAVIGETLGGCIDRQLAGLPAKQAAGARAEPQRSFGVLVNRPHLLFPQARDGRVRDLPVIAQPGQAAILAYPNVALPVDIKAESRT